MNAGPHQIFITGGTGYIGSRLIPRLLQRGHQVTALVREESRNKIPAGCRVVVANALEGTSYSSYVEGADTFIHLIGVPHPSPAKAQQFIDIDQKSGLEAVRVAAQAKVDHFIYMSVAHPAPVMAAYIAARSVCEDSIYENGLNATILRPWYVLGPGHRWPCLLLPMYRIAEILPATRAGALRLGLVSVGEMIKALVSVVSNPPRGTRLVEVPEIRQLAQTLD